MKKLYLTLIIFLTSTVTFAQNTGFEGRIVDAVTGEYLSNVIVELEGDTTYTLTNEQGLFVYNYNVPIGDVKIYISKDGYKNGEFVIDVLDEEIITLDEVEMWKGKSKRRKRKKGEFEQKNKTLLELLKLKKPKAPELPEASLELPEGMNMPGGSTGSSKGGDIESTSVAPQLASKFAQKLGVEPEEITNALLYEFIDEWMGTPYTMGGETRYGIDCSSFSQRLYVMVYEKLIERVASRQFDSKNTDTFSGMEYLKEGDLVFFRGGGVNSNVIVHVGVYLANGKFVHATANKEGTGKGEVKISDLRSTFWTSRFVCGGRRGKL